MEFLGKREDENMRIIEVFSLGKVAYDPGPRPYDRDDDRDWCDRDPRPPWSPWHPRAWDPQRRCWY